MFQIKNTKAINACSPFFQHSESLKKNVVKSLTKIFFHFFKDYCDFFTEILIYTFQKLWQNMSNVKMANCGDKNLALLPHRFWKILDKNIRKILYSLPLKKWSEFAYFKTAFQTLFLEQKTKIIILVLCSLNVAQCRIRTENSFKMSKF